jgi:hypothetical protein
LVMAATAAARKSILDRRYVDGVVGCSGSKEVDHQY